MTFRGVNSWKSTYIIIITTTRKRLIMINATTLKTIRNADMATINALIKEIKARQSAIQNETADAFRVGQSVVFDTKDGDLSGIIEKINRKTVIVRTDAHQTWRVSPSLLKPDNFYAGA